MFKCQRINIQKHTFDLFSERCVFWYETQTLLMADIHIGKSETFQKAGLAVPVGVMQHDLERLKTCIQKTEAKRLIILGDFIHHSKGMTENNLEELCTWLEQIHIEILLIKGNHDKGLDKILFHQSLRIFDDLYEEASFAFAHHPDEKTESFLWAGHVHPVVKLRDAGQVLRFPCFYLEEHRAILPAFGEFTGGYALNPRKAKAIYLPMDQDVIAFK